jgi:hypothetical protein
MITYPAILQLTGQVHPALVRAGVGVVNQWDAVAVNRRGVFRIDDSSGPERWIPLATDIDTTCLLWDLGIDPDHGRTTIEVRPAGTEVVVRSDNHVHGYALLDSSDFDMDSDQGLADYAEGG